MITIPVPSTFDTGGRKKDLFLFDPTQTDFQGEMILSFGTDPKFVVGIQKLAQFYAQLFLTGIGSDIVTSSIGNQLAAQIGGNFSFNRTQIEAIAQDAHLRTVRTIVDEQNALFGTGEVFPDDETLLAAEVRDIQVSVDGVSVFVRITSAAETSYTFRIPFSLST